MLTDRQTHRHARHNTRNIFLPLCRRKVTAGTLRPREPKRKKSVSLRSLSCRSNQSLQNTPQHRSFSDRFYQVGSTVLTNHSQKFHFSSSFNFRSEVLIRTDSDLRSFLSPVWSDQGLNWGGGPTGSQIRHLLFKIHYL